MPYLYFNVSIYKLDHVISVILNKLAEKAIERLLLTGILKLGWNKKLELLMKQHQKLKIFIFWTFWYPGSQS